MRMTLYWLSLSMLLIIFPMEVGAQPPPAMTYKIGGTITIDDTVLTQGSFIGYSIEVTKDGNVALDPVAETTSLLPSGVYITDIPVYDQDHTGAATPGETLEIHVYEGTTEFMVDLPYNAEITMGVGGETNYNVDIDAYSPRILTIDDPDNGSITPSPAAAGSEYPFYTEVTLTATPANGYIFSSWTGDVDDPSSPTTTIIMDADQTVTASFSQCSYTLTMAINDTQMGSITPGAGDNERACDAVVNITATPDSGYVFSSWTGDVANSSLAATTVTMDTDQEVTANFVAAADDTDDDSGDGGGGGGGGGIFGEISIRDVLGYHFDGNNSDGTRVYMPVTNAYKALKGAQTHVESFAPNIALFVRSGFDVLEQKAESNKDSFLYWIGTHTFPVFGKIAEYYLDIVDAERLKVDAYTATTISIEEFKVLEQQGKAVAPHRVNFESETKAEKVPIYK